MDTKKKIALFVPSMDGGGAEKVMYTLACGFLKLNYSVDLILCNAEGPYLKKLPITVNVIDLKHRKVSRCLVPLIKYIKKENPDVMLSTLDHACVVAVMAKLISRTKMPIFVRESTSPSEDMKQGDNSAFSKIIRIMARFSFKKASRLIAVSKGVKKDMVCFYNINPDKIEVIYNPVVTTELLEDAKIVPLHPFYKSEEIPVVLGVGRLSKEKDFSTLVRAFSLVREQLNARLVILGEGVERDSLEKLIRSLNLQDDVSLPGFVDNPCSYMSFSSVFVLSSLYEGLPNTLIQAMAVGTPIISTNCKYGPSEILEDGKFGRLVQVGDHKEMAIAIISALKEKSKNENWSNLLKEKSKMYFAETIIQKYESFLFQ